MIVMKLNVGDKVIWIEDKYQSTKGKVHNVLPNGDVVIYWDSNRIINYSVEQLRNMVNGHYSGIMILDVEAMRQDRLEKLGI